jgi:hypothetical protein
MPTPTPAPADPAGDAPAPTELASARDDRPVASRAGREPTPSKGAGAGKDSKAKDVPLKDLLTDPAKYANQEVTPSGLFRFGSLVSFHPNGTASISVIQSMFDIRLNGIIYALEGGQTAELDIEPSIANKLIVNNVAQRMNPVNAKNAGWGRNGAILTLRIMKAAGMSPGAGWILRIIKADLLVNLDFPRIYDRKFARSFQVYTITPAEELLGAGDGDEWQKRLGLHFLNDVAKVFKNYKNQVNQAQSLAISKQIGSMVNQSIRNVEAANAADAAQRRSMGTPRTVVSGEAILNQEINLNSALVR